MSADPILFEAGRWLGAAAGVLALLTVAGFVANWGIRFRLVGITSFTTLLAVSCLAFAVSYVPRVSVPGAVSVPIVFDNGADLVVAAAPPDLPAEAVRPTLEQVARNLRGSGRTSQDGTVLVRLRGLDKNQPGSARPVVLEEVRRDLASGELRFGSAGDRAPGR